MPSDDSLSLYEFLQKFPNEESARVYFEKKRWEDGRRCPHCGGDDTVECVDHKPMPYRCRSCRKHFSVRTGTVLSESKVPLHKWLMAIYMMTTARKGIPSTQMARELGVTQKTAWFLAHRIREAWFNRNHDKMSGQVQVDESYFGGKETNKHSVNKLRMGRGYVGKTPFVGIVSDSGKVIAQRIQRVDKKTLHGFIASKVAPGSTVVTDDLASYKGLAGYRHISINHSVGEYIKFKAHTNGIESFWALLKRGYYGIYHYMSTKNLHRYINEFSFRHNISKVSAMEFIGCTLCEAVGKRLTYKELVHG